MVFFICGLAAGSASLALAIFLRLTINGLFIPDIASQGLISITSGEIESQAVLTLGPLAKYSTFIGAIAVNIILYGFIGLGLGTLFRKLRKDTFVIKSILSTFISYGILVIVAIIFIVLNTAPGQQASIPSTTSLLFLILPHIVYGAIFSFLTARDKGRKKISDQTRLKDDTKPVTSTITTEHESIDYNKRNAIRAAIISAIALPLMYLGINRLLSTADQGQQVPQSLDPSIQEFLQSRSRPLGFEDPMLTPLVDAEVTPTYLFYRIDINSIVPTIDASNWNLAVKGLVDSPIVLKYDDIKNMTSVEEFATLSCISNKLGGDLVSTALWKGVRLRDILARAQVKTGVKYIVFRCADGYDVGIPFETGMMDGTILAYDMNNMPLTAKHGYPVRAIVPGFYGMMNPKWITEIELVDRTYEGFWQRKGWTNEGIKNIHSSIVLPGSQPIGERFPHLVDDLNFMVGRNIPIAGVAFAGDRGISKVEVSTDGGKTWKTAIVKDPLSQYTWVLWTSGFVPENQGDYEIVVRATDKTGKVQSANFEKPFPNGVQGYNQIGIDV